MKLIVDEGAAIPSFTCGAKSFEQALIESMMNEQIGVWGISPMLLTGENRSIRRRKSSRATLFTMYPTQTAMIGNVNIRSEKISRQICYTTHQISIPNQRN